MKSILPYVLPLALLFSGCAKKPTACLVPPEVVETGNTAQLVSCSENYEFLTWDFGDNSTGFVGDLAPHTYQDEGKYTITLTAYAKGGYRSDQVTAEINASYKYLDRFEVVGVSDYGRFVIEMGENEWSRAGASGTFTDEAPFVVQVWPDMEVKLSDQTFLTELIGFKSGNPTSLAMRSVGFKSNDNNPSLIEGPDFTLKLFWTYK